MVERVLTPREGALGKFGTSFDGQGQLTFLKGPAGGSVLHTGRAHRGLLRESGKGPEDKLGGGEGHKEHSTCLCHAFFFFSKCLFFFFFQFMSETLY